MIWKIKSPWLRIPAAWLFAATWAVVVVPLALIGAIIGAYETARDCMDWPALRRAMTDRGRG